MARKYIKILVFSLIGLFSLADARDVADTPEKTQDELLKMGNFLFPSAQQPGALISFGENILDKNKTQLSLFADDFSGNNKHMIELIPSILYGISDKFSVLFVLPVAASFQNLEQHSSGLEDSVLQFEYAYYTSNTKYRSDQGTVLVNVTFPTGSAHVSPPTGLSSPSFFLGTTYNRTYIDWLFFTSDGALLTTPNNDTQFGNNYLYQGGIGRNLFDIGNQWIFALILEADGIYMEKNVINGATDPNSGGNTIYVTPSLWIGTKKFVFQFGTGFPVVQDLFGEQRKNNYLLALNLSWVF